MMKRPFLFLLITAVTLLLSSLFASGPTDANLALQGTITPTFFDYLPLVAKNWPPTPTPTVTPTPRPYEWACLPTGITNDLNAVDFVDPYIGWVAGDDGTVLHTTDGGLSWQPQDSGTTEYLKDVFFLDLDRGWMVGVVTD